MDCQNYQAAILAVMVKGDIRHTAKGCGSAVGVPRFM
jgi:hypothetical protein